MTPQARCDYLAGMVALIQNHDDRIGTTDRMAMFLADVCGASFDETRFRQRVLEFHECLSAERERMRLTKLRDPAGKERAKKLRKRLAALFNEIDFNPRRTNTQNRAA